MTEILQNCELKSFESKTAQMLESAVRVLYYKQSIKLSGNKNTHCLTVIDNTIKILIPFSEVWYDKGNCPPDYVIRTISGAEIDYVITDIDRLGNCCIASRRKALKIRRRSFMKKEFIPGKRTECDIIAVGRSKAMCCCNGFDLMLRTQDISYGRIEQNIVLYESENNANKFMNNMT